MRCTASCVLLVLLGWLGAPTHGAIASEPEWTLASVPDSVSRARAPALTSRLANVSVRGRSGAGDATLIAGTRVQGSGNLPILVRAIGPGLAQFGVAGYLRAPRLEIYRGATLAAQTDSAPVTAVQTSYHVGAFPLVPPGQAPGDAALLGIPATGTLTAHCRPALDDDGIALLEFYDALADHSGGPPRFVNFSARGRVEDGEGLIVMGFVVEGHSPIRLLLRGVGPSLQEFGIAGVLNDPVVELRSGSTLIATNDNWQANEAAAIESAAAAAGAFPLVHAGDAALLVSLPAGSYTLQLRDARGATGIALAEIYEIPAAPGFDAAKATNAVGLDLYRNLAIGMPGGNLVLSPYSIESALALAYAGAEDATRREMAGVLRLPDDDASLQAGFATLRRALQDAAGQSKRIADARTAAGRQADPIEWHAANRLFGQEGFAFRDAFIDLMRDGFEAPLEPLDFRFNTEGARLTINDWVEEQTRDRIRDLIPQGGLTEFTRLVLVNALYLKASWDVPFEKNATTPLPFHPTPGTTFAVPTMARTGPMGYAKEPGLSIVTLDYIGGGLQFLVILPDTDETVEAIAARLTPDDFARWAQPGRREVALWLPKFEVEGATVSLRDGFRALGMNQAFDIPERSANFDRIAPRKPDEYLAISDIFHHTFIALDELGTEAAAATAVVIGVVTSVPPPPVEVRVDRPFLFAIQHKVSGACLFLGRISDPR